MRGVGCREVVIFIVWFIIGTLLLALGFLGCVGREHGIGDSYVGSGAVGMALIFSPIGGLVIAFVATLISRPPANTDRK